MIIGTFEKQPNDILDYQVDYINWIATGDALASASATVTPAGEMIVGSTSSNSVATNLAISGNITTFWARLGNVGTTYKVTVTAVTNQGRQVESEVKIKIKEY